jgi:hypothetical protein
MQLRLSYNNRSLAKTVIHLPVQKLFTLCSNSVNSIDHETKEVRNMINPETQERGE